MRIFFVDIDGTILDTEKGDGKVSAKTKYAFKQIKANGDLIFICSGRAKCIIADEIKELEPSGYILANGAYIEYQDKLIYSADAEYDALRKLISYCNRHGILYYLEASDKIYTASLETDLHKLFSKGWGEGCYVDEDINEDTKINIAMLALDNGDETKRQALETFLEPYFDYSRHVFFTSYDLNIKGVNKGTAIDVVLDYFNLHQDDAYAFGDGNNDLEMMKTVRHSIAMDNAVKAIKDVSAEITLSVSEDGFYDYLVKKVIIAPLN